MYSLIIVDYNGVDATIAHILRCRETLGSTHIVFVENGSNEGVEEKLQAAFGAPERRRLPDISRQLLFYRLENTEICYCYANENMGYARGNNLGVRIARALWSDFGYLISNNDLVFEKPFDVSVVDSVFAENPQVGLVGPKVVTPDGCKQSPQAWAPAFRRLILDYWYRVAASFMKEPKKSQFLTLRCNDLQENAPEGFCDWVSGCFFFVRADAFEQCGMFDEHTFLYGEEMILSRRLEKAGYKVWFCPRLEVIHKHGQSTKNAISVFRIRELDYNAVHYYYRTYTDTPRWLLAAANLNFRLYKAYFQLTHKLLKR